MVWLLSMERKSFYKKQTRQRLAAAIMLWLGCCVLALPQNTVALTGGEGKPGEQVTVGLQLKNTDDVTAMQVDVPLDDALSFVEGSEVISQERLDGHGVKVSATEDGFRILLYSLSLKPLKQGGDQLLTVKLKLKRAPGTYTLRPQVKLTGQQGTELECHTTDGQVTVRAARMEVRTEGIDFGRIPVAATYERSIEVRNTGNDALEISEITFSDSWLTGTASPVSIEGGSTGQIRVKFSPLKKGTYNGNISLVSDALDGIQTIQVKADLYTVNELHLEPVSGVCDEIVTVAVRLKNTEEVSAVQFALDLPEELEFIPGSEQAATSSHKANGTYKDGRLTMMVYSLSDAALACGDTELLSFKIRLKGESGVYDLTPSDVRIGNMQLENVCSAFYGTKVSISSPLMVYDDSLWLGNVDMTVGTTVSYTVQNAGSSALVIDKISFMDDRFEVMTTLPLEIGKGNKGTVQIKMKPSAEEGDLSTMMNIYSNDPESKMAAVNLKGKVYAPNTISLQCYPNVTDNQSRLDVCMQNRSDITAFQMDIVCPEDVPLTTENFILGNRMENHQLYCSQLVDGTYRISGFSLSNKPINGENGVLFSFYIPASNDIYRIENIKLSDAQSVNKYTGDGVELETVALSDLYLNLPEGWSWISCNLYGENLLQVTDFIQPISENVEQFVGFETELVYDTQLGLVGQLKTIEPETSYHVKLKSDIDNIWTGFAYLPEQTPVTLQKGWNWIGYVPTNEMALEDALENLKPSEGDVIKSYEDFSTFNQGKWVGTLTLMQPGLGYMYYSDKQITFHYVSGNLNAIPKKEVSSKQSNIEDAELWEVARHKYPNNMSMIAEVQDAQNSHKTSPYIIGAFVGNECRGIGKYVGNKIFMTIYGNADTNELITFRAYDTESSNEFLLPEACEFNNDMTGTLYAPFKLTLDSATDISGQPNEWQYRVCLDAEQETLQVYGNQNDIRKVCIMTHYGVVIEENSQLQNGRSLNVSHLHKGCYLVALYTASGVFTTKLLKTR